MQNLQHLVLASNEEYGLNMSSLAPTIMSNVVSLHINAHIDPKMLSNFEKVFPNVEILEFSFDRICCDCSALDQIVINNIINDNNNQNNNELNVGQNNNNNNAFNNNQNQENQNPVIEDPDEPYLDDNCFVCSEKCIFSLLKLQKLKILTLNGERIKDSVIKALETGFNLNTIIVKNCDDFNLKLLLITCAKMATNDPHKLITLKLGEKIFSRICVKVIPKNFKIIKYIQMS